MSQLVRIAVAVLGVALLGLAWPLVFLLQGALAWLLGAPSPWRDACEGCLPGYDAANGQHTGVARWIFAWQTRQG